MRRSPASSTSPSARKNRACSEPAACSSGNCTTTRSAWDTSRQAPHELSRVHRAFVRVPRQGSHPRSRAGDPGAPRGLPSLRRALRLPASVPRLPAGTLPRRRRASRPEAPDPPRTVRRVSWLTRDGLAASLAVGVAVTWGLGWPGLALLAAFFLSGSLLTQWASGTGGRRNARQVLANGGVAAAAALAGSWPAAAGAIAAATADTWATEIGSFSPVAPRLVTTWERVTRGASGGITSLGTAGGVAGAVAIAALGLAGVPRGGGPEAAGFVGAGVAGLAAHSPLGETFHGLCEFPAC